MTRARSAVPYLVVAAFIALVLAVAWAVDTHRTHTPTVTVPTPAAQEPPTPPGGHR